MKIDLNPNSVVYRVWKDCDKINAKQYIVIVCDNNNVLCKDDNNDLYKFNYFEDNLICDKDIANQLYLLYKKEFEILKKMRCCKDSENNEKSSKIIAQPTTAIKYKSRKKKPSKNIFEIMEENGFKSHQLTKEHMQDKMFNSSKNNTGSVQKNDAENSQLDSVKIREIYSNNYAGKHSLSQSKLMPKVVSVGSKVGIIYAGDNEVLYYTIVKDEYTIVPKFASGIRRNKLIADKQSKGANINQNEITENSPIAKAIMGRARGERFSVNVKGARTSGSIVSIE